MVIRYSLQAAVERAEKSVTRNFLHVLSWKRSREQMCGNLEIAGKNLLGRFSCQQTTGGQFMLAPVKAFGAPAIISNALWIANRLVFCNRFLSSLPEEKWLYWADAIVTVAIYATPPLDVRCLPWMEFYCLVFQPKLKTDDSQQFCLNKGLV